MGSMQEWATRLLLPAGVSASALPMLAARALRSMFLLYGGVGLLIWWLYRRPLATAVPRSLAAALSPTLSGALFAAGWISLPLIACGVLKTAYDLVLWRACRRDSLREQ